MYKEHLFLHNDYVQWYAIKVQENNVSMFNTLYYILAFFSSCDLQHGKEYNESPARMLSESFDLDIVGGKAVTAKQVGLSGEIYGLTNNYIDRLVQNHC